MMLFAFRSLRLLSVLLLLLGILSCGRQPNKNLAEEIDQSQEGQMNFDKIVLSEADEQGKRLWEMKANEAVYSRDKRTAQIQGVAGSFFKDGKVLLTTTATRGEVRQQTQQIRLEGSVKAYSLPDKITLQADKLEWQPKQDRLIATGNVILIKADQKIQVAASRLTASPNARRYVLEGNVLATVQEPQMQLKTERLNWEAATGTISSNGPLTVVQGQNGRDGNLRADSGQFNLKTQLIALQNNIQINVVNPPLQIAGNNLTWQMRDKLAVSKAPITIYRSDQNLRASANSGQADLKAQRIVLTGAAQVQARNGSQLSATQLVWQMQAQEATASGNVVYRQPQNSALVTGDQAVAKLKEQTIQVTGGNVTTQLVP
ncbi:LPS export ABC transporter periplasmic protein LptC [Leptolyngbya sp. FACHB-261]|uniref:LPS export ABC transporter periplasmic protein LptC n=1 Tax=Leptolyngbya sp. FACHB-261 TaxID=2692806 RepID=UPI001689DDA5|nr:LPS export ABC transporter periplasmic protein LptC [Leptolyngbya sp. FACHB-261]MBD2102204.1 LPS export ABC transporter periplasmic protein LptC [Leptolyngbya sp. FACHB-261]